MISLTASGLDRLRRQVQTTLFARLPEHVERLGWSADQIAAHQRNGLRSVVAYAMAHSPFHAVRLAGVEPGSLELSDLASPPVMTKAEMMADLDGVPTDSRLSANLITETLAVTGAEPRPILGEFVCLASDGSSGRRGSFVYDLDALADLLAILMRRTIARMPDGPAPPARLRIAMVGASSPVHGTGLVPHLLDGSPIRFVPVPGTLPLDDVFRSGRSMAEAARACRAAGAATVSGLCLVRTMRS